MLYNLLMRLRKAYNADKQVFALAILINSIFLHKTFISILYNGYKKNKKER